MNDREKCFMMAGIHAQKRWNMDPETVNIIKAQGYSVTVPVPVVSTRPFLPWVTDRIRFSEEIIQLEKFVDKSGNSVRIGYGLRSNTLAVRE